MKNNINKFFSLLLLCLFAGKVWAQFPENYYVSVNGKSGAALKTAFSLVIDEHKERTYKELWTDFYSTDARTDGKVWDMYSSVTNYTFGNDQGKNYKKEGDTYNREHSFPKSWFGGEVFPMYTDLFHLVPTDGYVNNRRSNYPFGETNAPTWSSSGGFSKLGPSCVSGYSGTVFEPNDEYKGDFARIYFYMATRYEDLIASWKSDMLSGNSYKAYTGWALQMLLDWAENDPVSQKEIDRNNEVYAIQGNRNPFVDFPGLEQYVWGDKADEKFYVEDNSVTSMEKVCASGLSSYIVLDLSGRIVAQGAQKSELVKSLSSGVYIVGEEKFLVK